MGGGGSNGYIQNWRATVNGMEWLAEAHNHGLLCLDEIGQLNPAEAGAAAYMLANETGKTRGKPDGGLQHMPEWKAIFLSTGETTLADIMSEKGQKVKAGQTIRLADIPADAGHGMGIFEELHGLRSPGALADHLKEAALSCYGSPIAAYLDKLVLLLSKAKSTVVAKLREDMERFRENHAPADAAGQVGRVANRFALVAAAGELAARFKILPVAEGECIEAAGACFAAWLENRGGDGPQETGAILSQVRHYLEKNRARFQGKEDDGRRYGDVVGLIHTFEHGDQAGTTVFAVYPEIFRKDICQGLNHRHVVEVLKQAGYLLTNEEGRSKYKLRIGDNKTSRFYAIDESILGVEADTEQGATVADDEVPF